MRAVGDMSCEMWTERGGRPGRRHGCGAVARGAAHTGVGDASQSSESSRRDTISTYLLVHVVVHVPCMVLERTDVHIHVECHSLHCIL